MYIVDKNYAECTVYFPDKKVKLGDMSQKDLKFLFDKGHLGIAFTEKPKKAKEDNKGE